MPSRIAYRLYLLTMRWEAMVWLKLRRKLVDLMLGRKHKRLNIFPGVFLEDVSGLTIGDDVSINRGCNLSCAGGLTIGDHVSIAHGCSILTTEHGFSDPVIPIRDQPVSYRPVRIGSNVWVGANVTILAGVSIGDGSVIAAGAVVTKDVAPETISGGVPARAIKGRC